MAPDKKYADVLSKLSALPQANGVYLAAESVPNSYTNPKYWGWDFPMVAMCAAV